MSAIRIREYSPADLDRLRDIHSRQGIDYPFPNLESPDFIVKAVIENGTGVDTALLLRRTAEVYLLMDREKGTPADRIGRLAILNEAVPPLASSRGVSDVFCCVPPQIERAFSRRMIPLGWRKEPWPVYSRRIA